MPLNTSRIKNLTYLITMVFFALIVVEMIVDSLSLSTNSIIMALVVDASLVAFAYFLPTNTKEKVQEELFSIHE